MRRLGGLVLFMLLTGCGAAAEVPVRVAADAPAATTATTATSAPTTSSTAVTTTTTRVTSTTTRVTVTTSAPTSAPATRVPVTSVASTRPPTSVPTTTAAKPAGGCDPNYSGACVPIGPPDVDCGDLTARRFRVIGIDVHRLDADSDGIACES